MKRENCFLYCAVFFIVVMVSANIGFAFTIYDGTLYGKKPDLAVHGVKAINILYEGSFWKPGEDRNNLPSRGIVAKLAQEAFKKKIPIILDIEHWELAKSRAKGQEQVNLTKYLTVLRWFRSGVAGLAVGYYGNPPIRDYWRSIAGDGSAEYRSWQQENDILQPIANEADALYPSLYTFYPDKDGWVKYAKAQVMEARRYGGNKPVYVFLWPQYHESNRLLGLNYVPADFWRIQLETVKQIADGVVIWGGWDFKKDSPAAWDENAPWWKVTKEFLKEAKSR
jgi:hypothetical protein